MRWQNGIVIVLSLIVALSLAELGFRVTGYEWERGYQRSPSDEQGRGIIYGEEFQTAYTHSPPGLRRDTPLTPHEPGEIRILMIGDSFTFGLGVRGEDAYPAVVERKLRPAFPTVSVLNAGISGTYAAHQAEYLREHWDTLSPDWLVVQIFLGNDFYDSLQNNVTMPLTTAGVTREDVKQLLHSSRVLSFLWDTCALPLMWNGIGRFSWGRDWLYRLGFRLVPESILFKTYYPGEKAMWETLQTHLTAIATLANRHRVPMVLLIVPFREQVTYYQFLDDSDLDFRKPNQLLKTWADTHQVPMVDLLDNYTAMDPKKVAQLFYRRDMHWNAEGQAHAGRILADFLADHLTFDRRS